MQSPLSVSELNTQINGILESTFTHVYVSGEISNLTYHSSGHIYFSMKDESSTISCVMFKGNASGLRFRLEAGMKINLHGNITVYVPRGSYQILCTKIEPSGVGELALAYEQLKTKLQIKGYFDSVKKKQFPKIPSHIFVVTSPTGAAIEDMKKILAHRFPLSKMVLIGTLVQGVGAKEDITKGIQIADRLAAQFSKSVIIVGRGGGSIEDLWAFNEECVAEAIFHCNTPIVSAVGHENDFVISDFVADMRASTPSNAIELLTPNKNELLLYLDALRDEMEQKIGIIFAQKRVLLESTYALFLQHSFEKRFEYYEKTIEQTKKELGRTMSYIFGKKSDELRVLFGNFEIHHPNNRLKKGFVQVSDGKKIVDIDSLESGDMVVLESISNQFQCKIIDKKRIF